MESSLTFLDCTVCRAPLHVWEYARHLKGCVRIAVGSGPVLTAAMIHLQDQQAAWRRNKALGHWVPGKDPRSE